MLKVGIVGCEGRMGQELCRAILEKSEELTLVFAISDRSSVNLNKDIGEILGIKQVGVKISSDLSEHIAKATVIIDFTASYATMSHLPLYKTARKPLVIGTTGFTEDEKKQIQALGDVMPILLAPNMTIGVNLCAKVVKDVASALGDNFDIEIIESHHRHKVDAPSGTSLYLGEEIAQALDVKLADVAVVGRTGKRKPKEIGFAAVRAGGVFGEHTVLFASENESIEITHKAFNRRVFTDGALLAAKWLTSVRPGFYAMKDVLMQHTI